MSAADSYPADPRDAVIRLFDEHGERIYRLGLRLCDRPDFAQDLVQETFLRAYRGWSGFDGRSKPSTWLYTIASRACQRLERRRAGQPRRLDQLSELVDFGAQRTVDVEDLGESPLEAAARSEEVRRLHRAVSALPAKFRLPLVLKELEELSLAEVGEILGMPEATVKTRLHRARLTLRKAMSDGTRSLPTDDEEHERRRCADFVVAKLEAMAHGVDFPVPADRVCGCCAAALASLDEISTLANELPVQPLPAALREAVIRTFGDLEGAPA
jgi:RNA polymerase sigma-70 factor (ECF subfamily)